MMSDHGADSRRSQKPNDPAESPPQPGRTAHERAMTTGKGSPSPERQFKAWLSRV